MKALVCEECGCFIEEGEDYIIFDEEIYCSEDCRNEEVDRMTFYKISK